ncbi:MAG: hypothetical protein ACYSWP_22140, partial [Planctomycetota bacterium]
GCEGQELDLHKLEDLDGSRSVNNVDFAILAANWLECMDRYENEDPIFPTYCYYDFSFGSDYRIGDVNRDLCVDMVDLRFLVERWLSEY